MDIACMDIVTTVDAELARRLEAHLLIARRLTRARRKA